MSNAHRNPLQRRRPHTTTVAHFPRSTHEAKAICNNAGYVLFLVHTNARTQRPHILCEHDRASHPKVGIQSYQRMFSSLQWWISSSCVWSVRETSTGIPLLWAYNICPLSPGQRCNFHSTLWEHGCEPKGSRWKSNDILESKELKCSTLHVCCHTHLELTSS